MNKIPLNPDVVYSTEWRGWDDFLGVEGSTPKTDTMQNVLLQMAKDHEPRPSRKAKDSKEFRTTHNGYSEKELADNHSNDGQQTC